MSSTKVRKLTQRLAYTATYTPINASTGTLTVTTASAHGLVATNTVQLFGNTVPQDAFVTVVTAPTTTSFTATIPSRLSNMLVGQIELDKFFTGFTGRIVSTMPRSTGATSIIQSFVTGTGGAVYDLEVSLDAIHWVKLSTVTHATVTGDTGSSQVAPNWAYFAINVTSIGAATSLGVLFSA